MVTSARPGCGRRSQVGRSHRPVFPRCLPDGGFYSRRPPPFHPSFFEPLVWELPGGRALDSTEWRGLKMYPFAVPADGQRFATVSKREVRLYDIYDAATGERLTPPLRNDDDLVFNAVTFSPDGGALLVRDGERARLWPLPKDDRPVDDWVLLAQLLSARRIDAAGNYAEWPAAAASRAWQTLRATYPGSFTTLPGQLRVWRERIVEASLQQEQW